jgi:hypothetical protein
VALLENTPTIAHIDPAPYAAIFVPGAMLCFTEWQLDVTVARCDMHAWCAVGGHGISWDGPFSKEMQRLIADAFAANKVPILRAIMQFPFHPCRALTRG